MTTTTTFQKESLMVVRSVLNLYRCWPVLGFLAVFLDSRYAFRSS